MTGVQTCALPICPAVAITLVEMGVSLPGVRTALDVERGMALIGARLGTGMDDGDAQD